MKCSLNAHNSLLLIFLLTRFFIRYLVDLTLVALEDFQFPTLDSFVQTTQY